jgi:hypothetical protein
VGRGRPDNIDRPACGVMSPELILGVIAAVTLLAVLVLDTSVDR